MNTSANLDPFELWRQFVNKLESNVNSLAGKHMTSEQFTAAMGQFSQVSGGLQKAFEKVLDGYFKALRLPSRQDIADLTDAVRRLEDKVELLTPIAARESAQPRPQRTRKAPSAASAPQPEAIRTPAKPAAKPVARKPAKRPAKKTSRTPAKAPARRTR